MVFGCHFSEIYHTIRVWYWIWSRKFFFIGIFILYVKYFDFLGIYFIIWTPAINPCSLEGTHEGLALEGRFCETKVSSEECRITCLVPILSWLFDIVKTSSFIWFCPYFNERIILFRYSGKIKSVFFGRISLYLYRFILISVRNSRYNNLIKRGEKLYIKLIINYVEVTLY